MALLAALLMQVITNLQNDLGFTQRGGESRGQRQGLPRATAQGWLSHAAVGWAIRALSLLATGLGLALLAYRGWPVLWIGSASLLAALAYMGGPRPIAYTPFGELTAFLFFGPVAVGGTQWLVSGEVTWISGCAALAIGALTAAALVVNNHRDQAHDRMLGRQTLVVKFGPAVSLRLFSALLIGALLATPVMAWATASAWFLLPCGLFVHVLRIRRRLGCCQSEGDYNQTLFQVFRLELQFASLLAAAALLAA
jgi:1,4-dihydroxy-2-naphthoate octaprenyltransferase